MRWSEGAAKPPLLQQVHKSIIALNEGVLRPADLSEPEHERASPSRRFESRRDAAYGSGTPPCGPCGRSPAFRGQLIYGMTAQPIGESPTSRYSGRALGGTSKISGTLLLPPSDGIGSSMLRSPCCPRP